MKICVVNTGWKDGACAPPEADVTLLGFGALGEVDYEEELSGKSEKFEKLARFSGVNRCGVLGGCTTLSRGLRRRSVAVADCGKLLGISDMLNVLDEQDYKSGAGLGVYKLRGYTVGACVESDLYFPSVFKAFSLCGCNLITVHTESVSDNMPTLLMRAYSYLYGTPVVLSAGRVAYFSDCGGVIACSNQDYALFEVSPRNRYRVVTTRRRGLFGGGDEYY